MTRYNELAIILLAAGNSSRMGTPKQMLNIGPGSLLEHSVTCAIASNVPNILVVLGAHAVEHKQMLKGFSVNLVVNPEWARGIGRSLKLGLSKAIEHYPGIQAVMVLVCDQPLLSGSQIKMLSDAYVQSHPYAVASQYNGVYGVPAVFDRSLFSELLSIDDGSGAREILKKWEGKLLLIPFEGGEIDLDTPEDYKKFIERKAETNK